MSGLDDFPAHGGTIAPGIASGRRDGRRRRSLFRSAGLGIHSADHTRTPGEAAPMLDEMRVLDLARPMTGTIATSSTSACAPGFYLDFGTSTFLAIDD